MRRKKIYVDARERRGEGEKEDRSIQALNLRRPSSSASRLVQGAMLSHCTFSLLDRREIGFFISTNLNGYVGEALPDPISLYQWA